MPSRPQPPRGESQRTQIDDGRQSSATIRSRYAHPVRAERKCSDQQRASHSLRVTPVYCYLKRGANAVELIGALSNPETPERLERLATKLSQIEAGGATPRPTTTARNLRVGAVPDAIMRVLADSVEPMRMRDIQTEVEALVGSQSGDRQSRTGLPTMFAAIRRY
jgi:hypothetical protein